MVATYGAVPFSVVLATFHATIDVLYTITLLFHAYIYLRCLERGGLEWSYSVAEEKAVFSLDCFIRIYYMILYKINVLLTVMMS